MILLQDPTQFRRLVSIDTSLEIFFLSYLTFCSKPHWIWFLSDFANEKPTAWKWTECHKTGLRIRSGPITLFYRIITQVTSKTSLWPKREDKAKLFYWPNLRFQLEITQNLAFHSYFNSNFNATSLQSCKDVQNMMKSTTLDLTCKHRGKAEFLQHGSKAQTDLAFREIYQTVPGLAKFT